MDGEIIQDVERQPSVVRAAFDEHRLGNGKILQPAGELAREQFPKERSDRYAGKEVALSADSLASLFVVTETGRVECQFHEAGEGDRAVTVCLLLNKRRQGLVALVCVHGGG